MKLINTVKNPHLRHATVLAVAPLVAVVAIFYFVCSLLVAMKVALRTAMRELQYDYYTLKRIVVPGLMLAWMGEEAYEARVKALADAKMTNLFRSRA
jgi:hypothetical protein